MGAENMTSFEFEYVVDEKTYEVMSGKSVYTYNDGAVTRVVSEITYDVEEEPEMVKVFLEYANQTEDLRNITVVTNPGTEKEISQSVQMPKGLHVDFGNAYDYDAQYDLFTDAACTEIYEFYEDTDSDQTIYVKWAE